MSNYEIQEIRRIRHQVSAEYNHDLRKLAEYYRRIEKELRNSGKYKFLDESMDFRLITQPNRGN
ncbi:MAG: hypothetical protein GY862_11335 [Gammaproteobacteria bacterium]|nr:hypothetical protein [Gammaproteobacteria bacterium]